MHIVWLARKENIGKTGKWFLAAELVNFRDFNGAVEDSEIVSYIARAFSKAILFSVDAQFVYVLIDDIVDLYVRIDGVSGCSGIVFEG